MHFLLSHPRTECDKQLKEKWNSSYAITKFVYHTLYKLGRWNINFRTRLKFLTSLAFKKSNSPFFHGSQAEEKRFQRYDWRQAQEECAIQPQYISFKYHFIALSDVSPKILRGKEISGINLLCNLRWWFRRSEIKKNKPKIGWNFFCPAVTNGCFDNPFNFFFIPQHALNFVGKSHK